MDIYEAIKKRRSVRLYKEKKIENAVLNRILEAARLAPSANNVQGYKLIIVKDSQKRQQLAKAGLYQSFISQAPIIIVGVAVNPELDQTSENPFYAIDLAIAFDHLTLVAASEGLGTCWIGAFKQDKVKKILEIPEKCKVIVLMPIGFPDDKPKNRSRKSLKELIYYEKFSNRIGLGAWVDII
ncbi:nitroreductase family protein [Patescibacteria group bacterium]|nr:nitroreductase family protein [Patescibacteria group bacterium]